MSVMAAVPVESALVSAFLEHAATVRSIDVAAIAKGIARFIWSSSLVLLSDSGRVSIEIHRPEGNQSRRSRSNRESVE